jgi:hypothetical protein
LVLQLTTRSPIHFNKRNAAFLTAAQLGAIVPGASLLAFRRVDVEYGAFKVGSV